MSVIGPKSLGRSPNLERGAFRGSGHVSYERSGHAVEKTRLRKEPERTKTINSQSSLMNLYELTPTGTKNPLEGTDIKDMEKLFTEDFNDPFYEPQQGPFTIPDGSLFDGTQTGTYRHRGGIKGRYGSRRKGSRGSYTRPIPRIEIPIVYDEKKCGTADCNLYWNKKTKKYVSDPNTSCTCCSKGTPCRDPKGAPDGVKYNDCCPGLKCSFGTCS